MPPLPSASPPPFPPTFPLDAVRARFPALARAEERIVHADAPGGTQVLDTVIEAMGEYLVQCNANTHGDFAPSRATDALCDRVRAQVAEAFGGEPDGVVFGANMTTLTWHFSHALTTRLSHADEIVCTQLDHDANIAPWLALSARTGAQVRWVRLDDEGRLDESSLRAAVTPRTRLVALPAASNALGTVTDVRPFVEAARAVRAWTYLDAVHAAPHVPLSRRALGVDVLACSPYKFFGPHAGLLVADPALLGDLTPDKVRPSPDTGPERWQTGTAAFEAIAGIGAALTYLAGIGMDAIAVYERTLSRRFLEGLDELPHVRLHGPRTPDARTPTFAVTVEGHTPDAVARRLAQRNVYTWSGHYYAVEPMRALGLLERGGAVRIGFVHYHGADDVDAVLDALADLA